MSRQLDHLQCLCIHGVCILPVLCLQALLNLRTRRLQVLHARSRCSTLGRRIDRRHWDPKVSSCMEGSSVFSPVVCACPQIAVCCLLAAIVIYSVRPMALPYTCVQRAARGTCLLPFPSTCPLSMSSLDMRR